MKIHPFANEINDEVKSWRHYLHQNPELSLEEHETSAWIKSKLDEMGIPYTEIADTGIVATIKKGTGNRAIGFRCELDALAIHEETGVDYKSKTDGKMHACGHDGHMSMLLGAAKALNEVGEFDGIVQLIFQPGEEMAGGADIMIKDGLFEKCPMEEIYSVHNWPGIPVGQAGLISGPVMASGDVFEITLTGKSGHGAMPSTTIDPVIAGAQLISALQSIVSRNVDPLDKAVISATIVNSGMASNIIPDDIKITGTVRAFKPETREMIEKRMQNMVDGFAIAFDVKGELDYQHGYPSAINDKTATENADSVVSEIIGDENVHRELDPSMASEDFSFMLEKVPGNYLWMGNGDTKALHNSGYDFNDELIPIGISYWLEMAKQRLNK